MWQLQDRGLPQHSCAPGQAGHWGWEQPGTWEVSLPGLGCSHLLVPGAGVVPADLQESEGSGIAPSSCSSPWKHRRLWWCPLCSLTRCCAAPALLS